MLWDRADLGARLNDVRRLMTELFKCAQFAIGWLFHLICNLYSVFFELLLFLTIVVENRKIKSVS